MKKLVIFTLIVAFGVACSKDQKAVNALEGTWNATKLEVTFSFFGTSVTVDIIEEGGSATFTFTKCKLKKDEWCPVTSTIDVVSPDTTFTSNALYRVVAEGTQIETKETDTSTTVTTINIEELTKTSLKVNFASDDLGGPVDADFTK